VSKRWSVSLLDALRRGDFAQARHYISEGIDPSFCTGEGNALHILPDRPGYVEMFDDLVAAGCDIHYLNHDGRSLFVRAGASFGHEICKRLISAGVSVNGKDPRGLTALHWAVANPKSVRILLEAGAEVDAKTVGGTTPLLRAAHNNRVESFRLLVSHGADIHVVDSKGRTTLHAAAGKGSSDIVRFLIDQGLDVNALDAEMKTPLHIAARAGRVDVCRLLIDAGSDSGFRIANHPKGYLTPFQEAVYAGHISTVSFFHDYCGEQPYQKTPSGMRIMALTRNRPEMRDFLVRLRDEIALRAVVSRSVGSELGQRTVSRTVSPL
jgi:ankyrin repeat protein